jgi:hypothetical protein
MLSIARSRLALACQFLFLVVNAFALLLGLIYNHRTPELYENNAHGKIGWVVTWIASAWIVMALIEVYAARTKSSAIEHHAGHDLNAANMAQYQRIHNSRSPSPPRWSNDSGQGTERNSASLYGHSRSTSLESEQGRFINANQRYTNDAEEEFDDEAEKRGFLGGNVLNRFPSRSVARFAAGKPLVFIRFLYVVIERTILVQGFVAVASGTIVYGGIGVRQPVCRATHSMLTIAFSTAEPSSTSSHTTSKVEFSSDTGCSLWADGWELSRIMDGRGTSSLLRRW